MNNRDKVPWGQRIGGYRANGRPNSRAVDRMAKPNNIAATWRRFDRPRERRSKPQRD